MITKKKLIKSLTRRKETKKEKELSKGILAFNEYKQNNCTKSKVEKSTIIVNDTRKQSLYKMTFGMTFVSKDNEICASIVSCRDYLHDEIRTFLNNKNRLPCDGHPYYPKSKDPDLCMDELRLLIQIKDTNIEKFEEALTVLNDMESFAGLTLTKAKQVNCSIEDTVNILLIGDSVYMKVPHLLSLLTLTLRFCTLNLSFNYEKLGDLAKWYKYVNKNPNGRDLFLMKYTYKWMHFILYFREELFKGKTPEELFPVKIEYNFHSMGGIKELCSKNSNNDDVNKKIEELQTYFNDNLYD